MRVWVIGGCLVACLFIAVDRGRAQEVFLSGQNVQPAFEGWQRNSNGTFTLFFGYLNRNYQEEPHVPVGADNSFQPGPADRGQPTHFYPRRQLFVFSIVVPADFGKQELVWTLTHHGRTSTAVGSLMPVWEIDEGVWKANRGSGLAKDPPGNTPPSVSVVEGTTFTVAVTDTVTLTALASDDGRPGPRKVNRGAPPARPQAAPPVPVNNLPSRTKQSGPSTQDMVMARTAHETGLAVTWLHYRGPGQVTFEPMRTSIKPTGTDLNGKVSTVVRFREPGTYVLRAVADDGHFTSGSNVTVMVLPAAAAKRSP